MPAPSLDDISALALGGVPSTELQTDKLMDEMTETTVSTFSPIKLFVKAFALSAVIGAITFFAGVFLGIVGIGGYAIVSHEKVDFAASYLYVGAPSAITAFVAAFLTIMVMGIRNRNQP